MHKKECWSFEQARDYVRKLNLKNSDSYGNYFKLNKPNFLPSTPDRYYRNQGWINWSDWLGHGKISNNNREYWSFEQARDYVRKQNLKTSEDWKNWYKSKKRPSEIPSNPKKIYGDKFKGIFDWIGSDNLSPKLLAESFISYSEAKKFATKNQIKTKLQWQQFLTKLGNDFPKNIPRQPRSFYVKSKEWKGWGDFLNTGNIKSGDLEYCSYTEASEFAIKLGIKTSIAWKEYVKKHNIPKNIPNNVSQYYTKSKEWKGWGDFLNTGNVQTGKENFSSFDEAKIYAKKFHMKGKDEWLKLKSKLGDDFPKNIPRNPDSYFTKTGEWQGWADFLGYEGKIWSLPRVKKLLNSLIDSKLIYSEDGAFLLSFLGRNKLLQLDNNRHTAFFKNLAYAAQSESGMKQIIDYAKSDSPIPPQFSELDITANMEESFEERDTLLDHELEETDMDSIDISNQSNPLSNPKLSDPNTILDNTLVFESISLDDEAMEFYQNYFVHKLWSNAFENEKQTLKDIKKRKTKNEFTNEVTNQFLMEYEGTQSLKIPQNKFGKEPFLMQKYCAYKLKNEPCLANFSGTGAGKTFSAVLSSRVLNSKLTLIVCPNDVVRRWKDRIEESFSNSVVILGKKAFYEKRDESKFKYLVINWDKLNQPESLEYIDELKNQKIDFVILDELHFSKNQDTWRTKRLKAILTNVKRKNKDFKVLGMTATPIVNNLIEGKVILEILTGKKFDDVETNKPNPANATTLYEKFTNHSIRQRPNYKAKLNYWDVDAPVPNEEIGKYMIANPMAIEQYLTDFRLPEIIKHIEGQTIIYTDYVGTRLPGHDSIVKKIENALKNAKLSYGFYVGQRTDGLTPFKEREIQVLIASRPISVGIDDLQYVCHNLIFNVLPWTNAQYRQIIGRIERTGQENPVNIHHVRVNVSGIHYDRDEKIKRINDKKTLADCAVDGVLPEHVPITKEQAAKAAAEWLLRLSRGEISVVTRKEWSYELPPSEKKKRIVKYGDFTEMNRRFYTTHSSNLHLRLTQNKEEWITYHKLQEEAENTWKVIPRDEIIRRLKKLSTKWTIGDFGCGREPFLQNALGRRVKSFDHIVIDDISKVKPCDMSDVSKFVRDGKLDVAVFCLSLMGTNWKDYIKEAARCVIKHGLLFIAEPTRRAKEKLNLAEELEKNNFQILEEQEIGEFTFIEARKTQ